MQVLTLDSLLELAEAWRKDGQEIVFTNGCFDILHIGHLQTLSRAKAEGGKPAYTIFADATLEFFARLRPRTTEAGLRIRGVGPMKAERYLEAFLEIIRGWED